MSTQEAFAELRLAVAETLEGLAAAKSAVVAHPELDRTIAEIQRKLYEAEARLPASVPRDLAQWMCDACKIKVDLITSLLSTLNVGGQKAARATLDENAALVRFHVDTITFVASEVAGASSR